MKIGTTELLIILAVVVIVFGPTQIPKLTRMFGKSVKEFRNGMEDAEAKEKESADREDRLSTQMTDGAGGRDEPVRTLCGS